MLTGYSRVSLHEIKLCLFCYTSYLGLGKNLIGIGVVVKHTQFTKRKSYPGNPRQLLFWKEKKNTHLSPMFNYCH